MTSYTISQQQQRQQQHHYQDAQLVNVDYLTNTERQLIVTVLDRDAAVRQKEQTRIKSVFFALTATRLVEIKLHYFDLLLGLGLALNLRLNLKQIHDKSKVVQQID